MKNISHLLTLGILIFILPSCKKDTATINDAEKYFFKYSVEGRTLEYTGDNQIQNPGEFLAGVIGGYTPPFLGARRSSHCNVYGKPACFEALIWLPSITLGQHSLIAPGSLFMLIENSHLTNENQFLISPYNGLGDGTVIITEIGKVGGVIAGTFSGNAEKDSSNVVVPISGSFRLERKN